MDQAYSVNPVIVGTIASLAPELYSTVITVETSGTELHSRDGSKDTAQARRGERLVSAETERTAATATNYASAKSSAQNLETLKLGEVESAEEIRERELDEQKRKNRAIVEQMEYRPLYSPASDLWALGTVVYEMFAGSAPFGNISDLEMLKELHTDP